VPLTADVTESKLSPSTELLVDRDIDCDR